MLPADIVEPSNPLLEAVRDRRSARNFRLSRAALSGADLSGLRGDDLDLTSAKLDGALLRGAKLGACDLAHSCLDGADLSGATARECRFDRASLRGATLAGARLEARLVPVRGGAVERASKDGTGQVELATGQSGAHGLALDAERVYWVNYLAPGKVSAISKAGGTPTVLATGQPIGLAVDAWCVYWANGGSGSSDGSVMKASSSANRIG